MTPLIFQTKAILKKLFEISKVDDTGLQKYTWWGQGSAPIAPPLFTPFTDNITITKELVAINLKPQTKMFSPELRCRRK